MPPRLLILSTVLFLAGGGLTLRFLVRWVQALSRRYRSGVPYLYGSAGRAFLLMSLSLVLLAAGTALGAAGWGLAAYQPFRDADRAGTVRVTTRPDRTLSFVLEPAPGYPAGAGNAVAGVPAGRWSVVGRFILWHPSLHWLGLRDAHRVALILTAPAAENLPRSDSIARTPLPHPRGGWLWAVLRRHDRFLPLVDAREFQTPWRIGPAEDLTLYASRVGYLLAAE